MFFQQERSSSCKMNSRSSVTPNELTLVELTTVIPLIQWSIMPIHWPVIFRPHTAVMMGVGLMIICFGIVRGRKQIFDPTLSEGVAQHMQRHVLLFIMPLQGIGIVFWKEGLHPPVVLINLLFLWSLIGVAVAVRKRFQLCI
jgi:hypothetical protein